MKKVLFSMILLGFFVDYSFLSVLMPSYIGANLVLIVVTISCFERSFFEAVGWSLLAGLMLDYVSHTPFGTNIFLFVLLVWIFDFLRRKLLSEKISMFVAFMLFVSSFIFYEFARFIFLRSLDFFGVHFFEANFSWKQFFAFLTMKIAVALFGLLLFKIYQMAKKVLGVNKLEIKV